MRRDAYAVSGKWNMGKVVLLLILAFLTSLSCQDSDTGVSDSTTMENAWATTDTIIPESTPHIKGTIQRGKRTEFWLSRPCPTGVDPDDWEESEQARWDRIFKRGKK
jgi:hypothetical protein